MEITVAQPQESSSLMLCKHGGASQKLSASVVFSTQLLGLTQARNLVHLVASGVDNASSNGVMNCSISKRIAKLHGIHLSANNMSISCLLHVLHLSVQ